MSDNHLTTGSVCPPLSPGTLRLYEMKYCPYCHRVRLVLDHKNIPHEKVRINIDNKPEWYFSKNPAGPVPTLEQDGKLVQESGICMDYLDDITQGNDLYPEDAYLKARMRLDMVKTGKLDTAWVRLLFSKEADWDENFTELTKYVTGIEEMVKGKFFTGDKPMMIDFFVYPWFESFCAWKVIAGKEILLASRFPKLSTWVGHMAALPAVMACRVSPEAQVKYLNMFRSNDTTDFDFELK